jgi:dinuclear metal center YbgI/SA1388 family protein
MELSTLCDRLDDRLRTGDYADLDASANGFQVGPGPAEATDTDATPVERVAVAVDAAVATFEAAAAFDADLVVTHHGISWGGIDRVTGTHYRRIAPLIEAGMALYVSHLPLDGHQELGNAAGIADLLGVVDREPFGTIGPEYVGQRGRFRDPRPASDVVADLQAELDTGNRPVRRLDHGPDTVEDVAIVTGSGADWFDEAVEVGADLLVTGEGKGKLYHEAREAGVGVILAGHYATETFGVRALADLIDEWGLETTFVDPPTGL